MLIKAYSRFYPEDYVELKAKNTNTVKFSMLKWMISSNISYWHFINLNCEVI